MTIWVAALDLYQLWYDEPVWTCPLNINESYTLLLLLHLPNNTYVLQAATVTLPQHFQTGSHKLQWNKCLWFSVSCYWCYASANWWALEYQSDLFFLLISLQCWMSSWLPTITNKMTHLLIATLEQVRCESCSENSFRNESSSNVNSCKSFYCWSSTCQLEIETVICVHATPWNQELNAPHFPSPADKQVTVTKLVVRLQLMHTQLLLHLRHFTWDKLLKICCYSFFLFCL